MENYPITTEPVFIPLRLFLRRGEKVVRGRDKPGHHGIEAATVLLFPFTTFYFCTPSLSNQALPQVAGAPVIAVPRPT